MSVDNKTAAAFASSWNNLPSGSVYTSEQFDDWMAPIKQCDVEGRRVLELGCGNGSLLVHMAAWQPSELVGVDLGDSVLSANKNLSSTGHPRAKVVKGDLVDFRADGFDVVYCIGVLHHLKEPENGFNSVVANTSDGGRFHCWVYGKEGNALVRLVVEPTRLIASRLPWWITKYLIATPLVIPYFVYAKSLRAISRFSGKRLINLLPLFPLYQYSCWIASRDFSFFRHVAFDQLVTPQTCYISRAEVQSWLNRQQRIDPTTTYVIQRNGNSWKFGGTTRTTEMANS